MIVLDEQIAYGSIIRALEWYPGRVAGLNELRPGTVIKDEAVPALLRQAREPTFVTISSVHFWRRVAADRHFCILCFAVPQEEAPQIPAMLRRLLQHPEFSTKAQRMGRVVQVTPQSVRYYEAGSDQIGVLAPW